MCLGYILLYQSNWYDMIWSNIKAQMLAATRGYRCWCFIKFTEQLSEHTVPCYPVPLYSILLSVSFYILCWNKQEFVRPRWPMTLYHWRWPYDMRPLHVCHCNSLGGATWRSVTIDNETDGQTDRQTDGQSATQYAAPPREEGRIINDDDDDDDDDTAAHGIVISLTLKNCAF